MKKLKSKIALTMALLTCMFILPLQASASVLPFTDVKTTDWYYESVIFVYDTGLMSGTELDEFSPNQNMTRGEFISVIGRLSELLGEYVSPSGDDNPFMDVQPETFYCQYVRWAYEKGIVSGKTNTTFEPNASITREETAAIIQHYVKSRKEFRKYFDVTFADAHLISGFAQSAVQECADGRLLFGYPDGTFKPKNPIKRCEIASVLSCLLDFQINA